VAVADPTTLAAGFVQGDHLADLGRPALAHERQDLAHQVDGRVAL
jgi:hypothetical protein